MELSIDDFDYCQNPAELTRCHARQYLTCPHCSFHLCFEHGQLHQAEVQQQAFHLHHHAKHLEQTIGEYEPVRTITDRVFQSLNEWKQRMFHFINQYTEQVSEHIEQARHRLNDQWTTAKAEYLHLLHILILEPIEQLLRTPQGIHPEDLRPIHARLVSIQRQMSDLLTSHDLLRITFRESCCSRVAVNNMSGESASSKPIRFGVALECAQRKNMAEAIVVSPDEVEKLDMIINFNNREGEVNFQQSADDNVLSTDGIDMQFETAFFNDKEHMRTTVRRFAECSNMAASKRMILDHLEIVEAEVVKYLWKFACAVHAEDVYVSAEQIIKNMTLVQFILNNVKETNDRTSVEEFFSKMNKPSLQQIFNELVQDSINQMDADVIAMRESD